MLRFTVKMGALTLLSVSFFINENGIVVYIFNSFFFFVDVQ